MPRPLQGQYRPRHPQKYSGNIDTIIYRSSLELRLMRYFDIQDAILNWSSEEIKIPYVRPDDNSWHTYFPDFLIRVKQRSGDIKTILIEVKPSKQCDAPAPPKSKRHERRFLAEQMTYLVNKAKWTAAEAWCKQQGYSFLILTEKEIAGWERG